ncbi:MAG TPA: DUF452 family protein [Ignavibacteriales bacterium]|nr:DUF452 family protein [Ignavibacteriales bacterium]HRU00043.1 DUF452 family protein [Ignavibacteriales bacterium]
MNCELYNNNNDKLVLFFNGFGMDINPLRILLNSNLTILHINKYYDLNFEEIKNISKNFSNKIILSYSLGVYFAGLFLLENLLKFKEVIAINGTLEPINNNYGIDPKMFDLTIKLFDEKGRQNFYRNMFYEMNDYQKFLENQPNRMCDEQKNELITIKKIISDKNLKINRDLFTKIFVSKYDKIIPTKSQINFWEKVEFIETGHFPFYSFDIVNVLEVGFNNG